MAEIENRKPENFCHAEAHALSGHLVLPIKRTIEPQIPLSILPSGGYNSQRAGIFHLEQVISYRSAYTEVAGNKEEKPGHGWSTLATAVIEGLNILEVVTADRVVAQISTEHPLMVTCRILRFWAHALKICALPAIQFTWILTSISSVPSPLRMHHTTAIAA